MTSIGLSPGGSGYFTCIQNMKLATNKFKSGGLHEKHVVTTWNFGDHLRYNRTLWSIFLVLMGEESDVPLFKTNVK